jgi:HTH-type transcriptional regulator/antitoxin HipB
MKLTVSSSAQLSTHFKSLRRAKGWSQADLGQKLGLGQARIAQIEGDPGAISVDKFLQILHLLDAKLVIETQVESGPAKRVVDAVAQSQRRLNLQRDKEPLEAKPQFPDAKARTQISSGSGLLPLQPPLTKNGLLPPSKNSNKSSKLSITKKKW